MPVRPPTYRSPNQRSPEQVRADYERRRGSARSRGYDANWDRQAGDFKRAHPDCLGCKAVGRRSATAVVDHVIPHKGDRGLMWDKRNWQPSCRFHHDVVKQRLEDLYANGAVNEIELRLDSAKSVEITRDLWVEG
jgi:5-methylcytosine-specific restriction protein A